MNVKAMAIPGVKLITPAVFNDNRGWFTESYNKKRYQESGIFQEFIQDNHSYSADKNILRGIHFQTNPKAQSKLVRCSRGAIFDVAVDLRRGSEHYGKWISVELTAENQKQLFIPKGFGHGFITLREDVEVQYKVDEFYSKEHDGGIRFDDPELAVDWGTKSPVLSEKDEALPYLHDIELDFSIKVLVTGVNGQLGYDVVKRLQELHIDVQGVDIEDFDITDSLQVSQYLQNYQPDAVIHCAAYTAVDKAESDKEKCAAINIEGTRNIAKACRRLNAKLIYISTDYVFDGSGSEPHKEDEETAPINYYGYTKEQGEQAVRELVSRHHIIRTSWVYGKNGSNFVKTMLRLASSNNSLKVVNDQIGAPTYTRDLAILICEVLQRDKYGTLHGVNDGICSWYDFAREIFSQSNISIEVQPVPSEAFPTAAKRPRNSRLSNEALGKQGFSKLPPWKDALTRYLREITE